MYEDEEESGGDAEIKVAEDANINQKGDKVTEENINNNCDAKETLTIKGYFKVKY